MSNSNAGNGGIGFLGMLAILFIGLKLTNYVTWSWFWVLSPLLPVGVLLSFLLIIAIVVGIAKILGVK